MHSQNVAGTIILHKENGEKKFLIQQNTTEFQFITATQDVGQTGLSCILEAIKQNVDISIDAISLFELTNVYTQNKRMPFFVFEMKTTETKNLPCLSSKFIWGDSSTFSNLLQTLQIAGVPVQC